MPYWNAGQDLKSSNRGHNAGAEGNRRTHLFEMFPAVSLLLYCLRTVSRVAFLS